MVNSRNNPKLNKSEIPRINKKIKMGWKSTVILPDYGINDNGFLIIQSHKQKKAQKFIQFLDDGILIEKAIGRKDFLIKWEEIAIAQKLKSKKVIQLKLANESILEFDLFTNKKFDLYLDYIVNLINEKKLNKNSNVDMYY